MSMNAKERLQALRSVDAGIEAGSREQEAGKEAKAQEAGSRAQALGLSVLEGGLGNGWKN